jgi:uncharacterized protein YbaP (TraB family)
MGKVRVGRLRQIAIIAAAILLGVLGAAGAANAAPALWVVRDADSEIYLFGTLHALPPAMAWRTPAYDAAYAKADTVWFEAEVDKAGPDTLVNLLARYGVDRRRRISDRLPARDLAELRRQVDVDPIDHLRPWAAAMMLSMQPMIERGARAEAGADMATARRARSGAKTIRAFETLEDQARMFAGLPETSELEYLSQVIHDRTPRRVLLPKRPVNMEGAWLKGDFTTRLGPQLVADMRRENPALQDALLTRRNLAWADVLAERMAGSGVDLVNVGGLHMVGEGGLPALMRSRGFTVERIQ